MPPAADPARIADRVRFFRRVPPFKDLPADELERIAASLRERAVPDGRGHPRRGRASRARSSTSSASARFELVHKDAYVAVVTAGEVLGHPTLLTGLAPEFTVRAREDSLLYCIPRDEAVELLGRPAGLQWMAANLRERLLQAAGTMRALPDVRTLPVTSVTRSKPLFCDPETTAQEAAEIMIAEKRSAILVRGPGGRGIQGIVTDVDLRNKVVVGARLAPRPGHRDHVVAGAHHRRRRARARGEHRHDDRRREPHAGARRRRGGGGHPVRQQPDVARGAQPLRPAPRDHGGAQRRRAHRRGGRHPQALPRPHDRAPRRPVGDARAHGPARRAHVAAPGARHRPARRAAGALRLARLRQRRPRGAHPGLGPGQRAGARRHRRPRRGRLLPRARARRQHRYRALRPAGRPARRAREQPRLAHAALAVEGDVRGLPPGQGPRPHGARQRRRSTTARSPASCTWTRCSPT